MKNKNECCKDNCKEDNGYGLSLDNMSGATFSSDYTINYTINYLYSNTPKQKIKIEDIVIKQMDYGYLVKIGCQTIVVETPKKLIKAFKKYLKDPAGVEELFMQGEFMENLE